MKPAILLAFAVITCTACVPFRAYDTPKVSGTVRETLSLAPVAGATIKVTSLEKPDLVSTATSDANGQFRVLETWHNVWLLPLPYDSFYPDAAVTISVPGYRSLVTTASKLERPDNQADVTIRLDREKS